MLGLPQEAAEEQSYTLLPDGRAALPDRARALRAMVIGGVDETLVSLTAVRGIGPVFARRLAGAGIVDLEVLALSDVPELAAIAGVGTARATRWIEAAGARVAGGDSALRFIDLGPRREEGVAPPPGVDLYRLRRARELIVEGAGTTFYVRGGAEPHVVPGLMQSQARKRRRSIAAAMDRWKAARLFKPAWARMPQTALFSPASTCGAWPIRTCEASSWSVTSRR